MENRSSRLKFFFFLNFLFSIVLNLYYFRYANFNFAETAFVSSALVSNTLMINAAPLLLSIPFVKIKNGSWH